MLDAGLGWLILPTPCPLQEVVSHCKKLTKKNKEQLSDMMILDKQKGLKSLSKEKRQKLEAYKHLLYLLQVSRGLPKGKSLCPLRTWDLEAFFSVPFPPSKMSFPIIPMPCPQEKILPLPICLECFSYLLSPLQVSLCDGLLVLQVHH
jgi:hypothetical protein